MTESCLECQTKLFKEWEKFTPDKALIDSLMFNGSLVSYKLKLNNLVQRKKAYDMVRINSRRYKQLFRQQKDNVINLKW